MGSFVVRNIAQANLLTATNYRGIRFCVCGYGGDRSRSRSLVFVLKKERGCLLLA